MHIGLTTIIQENLGYAVAPLILTDQFSGPGEEISPLFVYISLSVCQCRQ